MSIGDAEAIIRVAKESTEVETVKLVDGRLLGVVLNEDQNLEQINLDKFLDAPRRKTGTVAVIDPPSFIEYISRHSESNAGTTLWGVAESGTIVAVLNDHEHDDGPAGEGSAGFGDHRATLTLPFTPDWKHWASKDGQLMDQEAFAEHIEDGASNVREPDTATMLEIAQTFQARTGVDFKSSTRLDNGETRLQYEETTQAKAGHHGSIEIPSTITLALAPFEGSPSYELHARFRYRINQGRLLMAYKLIRPDAVRLQAFKDVSDAVATATNFPVLLGTPRHS